MNRKEFRLPVTVIIPVRNRPKLLRQALDSVFGTVWPSELLVVSNGTAEDREADRKAFEHWQVHRQDLINAGNLVADPPEAHFLERSKPGPAGARNLGARKANQPWLAFLDSDDLWKPEKLEMQWNFLKARPHLKACHSREDWKKDQRQLSVPLRLQPVTGAPLEESLHVCLVSASSIMIQRQTFLELGGFDERFPSCEDFEFWIRYFLQDSMGCIPHPLVIKRSGAWKQVSGEGLLDLQRLRALLLHTPSLCKRGLQQSLLESARRRGKILGGLPDRWARRAERLLRRIEFLAARHSPTDI
ncbi:MAG: glycosyltransferase family 2 protein [Leptospiraceae bacterium]|nr:glycosyltransferase family 2 protein [Leptospiraceae bacterium]